MYSGLGVETIHVSQKHESENERLTRDFAAEAEMLSKTLDLSKVKHKIVHAKNIYGALLSEVKESDVVVIEGLHEGVFRRNFFGEVPERLAYELANPVILTKKYPGHVISWFQKFFGSRMPEPHDAADDDSAGEAR